MHLKNWKQSPTIFFSNSNKQSYNNNRIYSSYLFLRLRFGDELAPHLDPRLEERLGHVSHRQPEQMGHLLRHRVVGQRRLVRVAVLLELHRAEQHDGRHYAEYCAEVLVAEAHNVHRLKDQTKNKKNAFIKKIPFFEKNLKSNVYIN